MKSIIVTKSSVVRTEGLMVATEFAGQVHLHFVGGEHVVLVDNQLMGELQSDITEDLAIQATCSAGKDATISEPSSK
jgi:hypothetical protein